MIIYIWPSGEWKYSWDVTSVPKDAKIVNLDNWYDYNLNEKEVLACLEALEE